MCVWGGGGGGGGLWLYVHHTVDVKILCSDVVRRSGCHFVFSTLMSHVHLNTGSINLLVSMCPFVCLSNCLSLCPSYIHLSSYFSCPLYTSFSSESFFATS